MSRIYQALKRASEEAKQRKAPPQTPEVAADPGELELGTAPRETHVPSAVSFAEPPPAALKLGPDPVWETPAPGAPDRLEADEEAEAAADKGDPYRAEVRTRLQAALSAEQVRMAQEGKLLHQGQWLSTRQIQRLRRRKGWRDAGILIQLLVLFVIMGATNLGLLWFLRFLLPR